MGRAGIGDSRTVQVLHAEDDDPFRTVVADLLAREPDITVVSEATPEDAIDRLESEEFDCIISDYDGDEEGEFSPFIRATDGGPPCILLTGKERDTVACETDARIDEYLQKRGGAQLFEVLVESIRKLTQSEGTTGRKPNTFR